MTQRTVAQSCRPTVKQSMVVAQQIWTQLDSPVPGEAAILHVNLQVSNFSIDIEFEPMDLTSQALESAGPLLRKDPENPVCFRSYTTMPTIPHV